MYSLLYVDHSES